MSHPNDTFYEMPDEPDAIIFVVAPTYLWFENWCLIDNQPRLNPKDRRFRFLSRYEDAARLTRGRHWRPGDDILVLDGMTFDMHEILRRNLVPCGFETYLIPRTNERIRL